LGREYFWMLDVRVFIRNNYVFFADVGAGSEKVQGTRTRDQGKTFSLQLSVLIVQPLAALPP